MGVITYEMLTGKLPFSPDTLDRMNNRKIKEPVPSAAKVVMNCPVWLDQIVTQMLQPEPRSRPHTSKAVGLAFNEIKKIDRNKKAAVAQVSGGFNPLTAGRDKSEARKLLNRKKAKNKKENGIPFYERASFLAVCLIFVIGLLTYALWPASAQKLFDKGVALVESDEPSDWASGRAVLRKVARRNDPQLRSLAESYILKSQRHSLVNQAKSGRKTPLQSEHVHDFIDAYHLEAESKLDDALAGYKEILDDLDEDEQKREHIAVEVKMRIERQENYLALPANKAELNLLLVEIKGLSTEEELMEARKKLNAIIDRFGDNVQYKEVVDHARMLLPQLDKFVDKIRARAAEQEPETPDLENEKTDNENDSAQENQ